MGEGGTIGLPATIANAVADALAPPGIEVNELPITPDRRFRLIETARATRRVRRSVARMKRSEIRGKTRSHHFDYDVRSSYRAFLRRHLSEETPSMAKKYRLISAVT